MRRTGHDERYTWIFVSLLLSDQIFYFVQPFSVQIIIISKGLDQINFTEYL